MSFWRLFQKKPTAPPFDQTHANALSSVRQALLNLPAYTLSKSVVMSHNSITIMDSIGCAHSFGEPNGIGDGTKGLAAVCGDSFKAIGLCRDGTLICKGTNPRYTSYLQNKYVKEKGWTGITSVQANFGSMAALTSDGHVLLDFGGSAYMAVLLTSGSASRQSSYLPNCPLITDAVSLACSYDCVYILRRDGTVTTYLDGKEGEKYGKRKTGNWNNVIDVIGGHDHVVGLRADGCVFACGLDKNGQCSGTEQWRDVIAVSCSDYHTVGLRIDGTVVACGLNNEGQCEVSDWKNIIQVVCGNSYTLGLRADGTVAVAGGTSMKGAKWDRCNVSNWTNIIALATGGNATVGFHANGTLIACGDPGVTPEKITGMAYLVKETPRQSAAPVEPSFKTNPQIAMGHLFCAHLKSNGTVVAWGDNPFGQCNVGAWRSIVQIACGANFMVGLKADGTVVSCGNDTNQCRAVSNWENIASISCHIDTTVGIKRDGSVVACGGMIDPATARRISSWKNIVSVAFLRNDIIALRSDGTVVCDVSYTGDPNLPQIEKWKDIKTIACGIYQVVGLKSDGTAVAYGFNKDGVCEVDSWRNLVQIACSHYSTYGVTKDGRVLNTGAPNSRIAKWTDIAHISIDQDPIVGLRKNGTVVAAGGNEYGQCNVSSWRDVVDVKAGTAGTLALTKQGNVYAVGYLIALKDTK